MYPLPNDLNGGDSREQHPSTGAETMQTVGYSGRSNQVGNMTHHSLLILSCTVVIQVHILLYGILLFCNALRI